MTNGIRLINKGRYPIRLKSPEPARQESIVPTDLLLPCKLQPGNIVRLVSPARYADQPYIHNYIAAFESWGLRCDVGDSVLGKHRYMSGTDAERLDDQDKAL